MPAESWVPQDEARPEVKVTRSDLLAFRNPMACFPAIDKFRTLFGDEAEVTRENLEKAVAADLDIDWWAMKTIPSGYIPPTTMARADLSRACDRSRDVWIHDRTAAQWAAHMERVHSFLTEFRLARIPLILELLEKQK